MKISSRFRYGTAALLLLSAGAQATGMVPETSVVIVEQEDGEGVINIKNTDAFPVLLLTTLENIKEDDESLLVVTPPTARVEAGKTQRVRFMLASKSVLNSERLQRVIFEGVPPQQKNNNEIRMTIRQNLPVIIRPAGLPRDDAPWRRLVWKMSGGSLTVSNPSPYVVRLAQNVQTLPGNARWLLPAPYILPGQSLTIRPDGNDKAGSVSQVRISPATTWGYAVDSYIAPLMR